METYTINKDLKIEAWGYKTSRSWGHKARAIYQGREVASAKCVYQNRTWEEYTYQSVMKKLIGILDENKIIPLADRIQASKIIEAGDGRDMAGLRNLGMIAKLGDIFGKTKTESNDWKTRMLKAGLESKGLIMPEDWDGLDEETKTARLDGVIGMLVK